MNINKWFLASGVIWSILFGLISFYWVTGGMLGIRSLGGAIYEMAQNPTPLFIALVWITAIMKIMGAGILLLPLIKWKSSIIQKLLTITIKSIGIFLFLYGLINFITISLSAAGVLPSMNDNFATFWRLVFWEPYWMAGGVFYFFSIKKKRALPKGYSIMTS